LNQMLRLVSGGLLHSDPAGFHGGGRQCCSCRWRPLSITIRWWTQFSLLHRLLPDILLPFRLAVAAWEREADPPCFLLRGYRG
jgi:hypothetical protein